MSTSISIKELKELDPSSYQIVDIRDAVEISHVAIPGALAMKTEEIETSDAIDRTKKTIICCSRGRFSVAAADEAGQEKEVHSCTEKQKKRRRGRFSAIWTPTTGMRKAFVRSRWTR